MLRWFALGLLLLGGCSSSYEGYKYKPYNVHGQHYEPMSPKVAPGFEEEGLASHYWEGFLIFPGKTSLGENMWPWTCSGAHKTLPLPCRLKVTNLKNGRSTVIRINDRGPFVAGRILDVSPPVAKKLGFYEDGIAPVRIKVLSVGDGHWKIKHATIPRAEPVYPAAPASYPQEPIPLQQ